MLISQLDAGIGWKRLKKTLQNLQLVVNHNCPVKGHGISLQETETGTVISIDPKTSDDQQQQQQSNAVDGWVMLTFEGALWTDVTVVNPADCSQSTIKVLQNTGKITDYAAVRAWITLAEIDPSDPPPSINIVLTG